MTKKPDFEGYLRGVHSAECHLPDDDQPDDFVRWTEDELSFEDLMLHADNYAIEYARQELKDFGDNLQIFKTK